MIYADTYAWEFGIVIPKKTGVVFEQQTSGIMCYHVHIEGVYVLMGRPMRTTSIEKQAGDLLDELEHANRTYDKEAVKVLWKEIKRDMLFNFKQVDSPRGQPDNVEGLQWIKITALKRKHGNAVMSTSDWKTLKKEYSELIGKTVALIYPNSE